MFNSWPYISMYSCNFKYVIAECIRARQLIQVKFLAIHTYKFIGVMYLQFAECFRVRQLIKFNSWPNIHMCLSRLRMSLVKLNEELGLGLGLPKDPGMHAAGSSYSPLRCRPPHIVAPQSAIATKARLFVQPIER